jgi:membrane protein
MKTRALGLAAEMAFWLFLSLLPLAVVVAFLAARLALRDWSVLAPLLDSMPSDAAGVLRGELFRIAAWNGGSVTPLAAVFFFWLASTGVHSVFDAFEAQTGTERSWIAKRLLALGVCVALSCAGAVVALIGSGLGWALRSAHEPPLGHHAGTLWEQIVQGIVGLLVLYALVAGLFRVGIPRKARVELPLVPGTFVVVVLHVALALGYKIFIFAAGNGDAYLAGLAVIGVTMTALYLFAASILIGLGVSQVLSHGRAHVRPRSRS